MRDLNDPKTVVFGRRIEEYAAELKDLEAKLLAPISQIRAVSAERYEFSALPYLGRTVDVYVDLHFVQDEQGTLVQHDLAGWQAYQRAGKLVLNQQLLFQIGRRLLHAEQTLEVLACTQHLRAILDAHYIHAGVQVSYGQELAATVTLVDLEGIVRGIPVVVPEFTKDNAKDSWSYVVLAYEKPVGQNVQSAVLPETAKPFLSALLGEGYEEAGEVFQYLCSPKNDGTLREVRLWVPSLNNRPLKRAVVLGRDGDDWFYIYCVGLIVDRWPAVSGGLVGAQKNSS